MIAGLGFLAAAALLDRGLAGRAAQPPPGHTLFWVYAHWADGYQFDTSKTITGARAALKAFAADGAREVSILWGNDERAFTEIDAVATWRAEGVSGLGMPALRTYADVHARFLDAVRHVWRNSADFVLPAVRPAPDRRPDDPTVHAALLQPRGRTMAVGDSLLMRAEWYSLLLNDSIYALPDDMIWRVLVHEAAHMGYPNHGKDFIALVTAKGGVVAGAGTDSGGVIEAQVKLKEHGRYRTVRTFPQEQQAVAKAWVREQMDAARSGGQVQSWRLRWA